MSCRIVAMLLLVAVASGRVLRSAEPAPKFKPDDHFVHKTLDAADHSPHPKPETALEKDFVAMDRNNDKLLSEDEIMYRQYVTGCEPMEAQVRGFDYMRCADLDRNGMISFQEFNASTTDAWFQCVKTAQDRRAHGFVRFMDSDTNYDGELDMTELRVGILKLWGAPGEALVEPLMKCADKNKDGKLAQPEFHASIAAYNPATRSWQSWDNVTDAQVLACMHGAFKDFDARIAFGAVDSNKDEKISRSEIYDTMRALDGPTILSTTVDGVFDAADKDKDGYLNLEEFGKAGAAGGSFASLLGGKAPVEPKPAESWNNYGLSVECHSLDGSTWRIFNEALGRVQVTPTDRDKFGNVNGPVKVTTR